MYCLLLADWIGVYAIFDQAGINNFYKLSILSTSANVLYCMLPSLERLFMNVIKRGPYWLVLVLTSL